MKQITDLKPLLDKYDLFITDLWGVIHDGQNSYPGVLETLKYLKDQNKIVIFLSNAPRRSFKVSDILKNYDITPNLYHSILTSGEVAYSFFENMDSSKKYTYIGPEKDRDILDGTNHQEVAHANAADFVIATGMDIGETVESKIAQIEDALQHNLHLYCINPDWIVRRQDGTIHNCAGQIAKFYEEKGGQTTYFGKPYQAPYKKILNDFNIPKDKILCIGDAIETDIKGANNMGLDSLFITSGIHLDDLKTKSGIMPDSKTLEDFLKTQPHQPDFISAAFNII